MPHPCWDMRRGAGTGGPIGARGVVSSHKLQYKDSRGRRGETWDVRPLERHIPNSALPGDVGQVSCRLDPCVLGEGRGGISATQ